MQLARGEEGGGHQRGGNHHGVVSAQRKIDHDDGEHAKDELPVQQLME